MSVYKRGGVYWMHFLYRGTRVQRTTGQVTKDAAQAVERQTRDTLRQQAHGVAVGPAHSPTFQDWVEIYAEHAARTVTRPERIDDLLRGLLRFFGTPPKTAPREPGAPYHDLRLGDVVNDPTWLLKWETWLRAPKPDRLDKTGQRTRVWSGQTRNQYRSTLSQLFTLAMKPHWRALTGITTNPCAGLDRDRRRRRTVAIDRADLGLIISQASYHLRLAIAIALLTPKLREGNILALRFDRHFSKDLAWLTVREHKTATHTGRPLVAYVPTQLREILTAAKARAGKKHQHVITYHGRPVHELRGAVKGAVERAAQTAPHLKYGRADDEGITFHTLRHSASTLMGELGIALQGF